MNRITPPAQRLRPPSPSLHPTRRPPFTSLTIRTTDSQSSPPMVQQAPSSSSSQAQRTSYPIPIPNDKLEKALKLYSKWRTAQALAQRETASPADHEGNTYLHIPNTPTARSRTSGGSSRRNGTSISASLYDATDMTSVVSFDGAPSSANELISFNGTKVKQRVRRPFSSVGKARTALVRWLGSCPPCRERRVPCSLEDHHDIATLERLHGQGLGQGSSHPLQRSRSSGSNSSQQTARSTSGGQVNTSGTSGNALFGIGQWEEVPQLYNATASPLDLQSPGPDPLADIMGAPHFTNVHFGPAFPSPPDPYSDYSNGIMLALGRQEGRSYSCQHLGGCVKSYRDVEELQIHFARDHFPYDRLDQPVKYFCGECLNGIADPVGPCPSCGPNAAIETWIYGVFFRRSPTYQRPADGPAPMSYGASLSPYDPVLRTAGQFGGQWPLGQGGGNQDGNMDFLGDNTTAFNNFGGLLGGMNYGYNSFNNTANGTANDGNAYRTRQMALKHSPLRAQYSTAIHHIQRRKLLLLVLLLVTLLSFFTYLQVAGKAYVLLPASVSALGGSEHDEYLPKVGFVLMFTSFSTSFVLKQRSAFPHLSRLVSGTPLRTFLPHRARHRPFAPSTWVPCTGSL